MLNPITPHMSHALHQALGHGETLVDDLPWPVHDPAALQRDSVTLAVQVHGKLRGQIVVAVDAPRVQVERQAMSEESVRSEERRVGKECVRPCTSRWWPYDKQKKK